MRFVRAAVIAITAGLVVFFLAAPAMAHGRGSDASNYDSRIADTPDVPGMTWRIYNGDEYLGVSNQADVELLRFQSQGTMHLAPSSTPTRRSGFRARSSNSSGSIRTRGFTSR